MPTEERKAYRREWQRNNRERLRRYRLEGAIRAVIEEIEQEREARQHPSLISDPSEKQTREARR